MNDLEKYFKENQPQGRMIDKPSHFLIIYDALLARFRNQEVVLVEIGVGNGGSPQMWKSYLGPKAQIYGVDIVDRSFINEGQITYIHADQGSDDLARQITSVAPRIDILIDDGSHICSHQISTLNRMFPYLSSGGIYVCEDTHTSYREAYEGGYKREGTFMEYCKGLLDALHYPEDAQIPKPDIISQISSITFYRSMVVIKKSGGENPNV